MLWSHSAMIQSFCWYDRQTKGPWASCRPSLWLFPHLQMEVIVHTSIIGLFQGLVNVYLQHLEVCQEPEQMLYNLLYNFIDSARLLCQLPVLLYMRTSSAQNHWFSHSCGKFCKSDDWNVICHFSLHLLIIDGKHSNSLPSDLTQGSIDCGLWPECSQSVKLYWTTLVYILVRAAFPPQLQKPVVEKDHMAWKAETISCVNLNTKGLS